MGISAERVRQSEVRAVPKLRGPRRPSASPTSLNAATAGSSSGSPSSARGASLSSATENRRNTFTVSRIPARELVHHRANAPACPSFAAMSLSGQRATIGPVIHQWGRR